MFRSAAVTDPFKPVLAIDFHVADDHGQHLFMYVNSRDPIRHKVSSWRERRACCEFLNQGHRLSPLPQKENRQRPIICSTTHAPDQTRGQSQLLQCELSLAAPSLSYSAFDSERLA